MAWGITAKEGPVQSTGAVKTRIRDASGQSLVIVVLAMTALLGMAAVAIDLATWYQKHHQAQLAADAAALAAAQCMGSGTCTSTSAAASMATTYANSNNVPASSVTVDTTSYHVTVTTGTSAPISFAGLFNVHPSVSASATASWVDGLTDISLFAGDTTCGTGDGIYFASNGGGQSYVPGIHSNGEVFVRDHSGSTAITGSITDNSTGTGPFCSGSTTNTGNVSLVSSGDAGGNPNGTLPWPEIYSPPACTTSNTATYWTTDTAAPSGHQIVSGGGVYCVTTSFSGTCGPTIDGTAGTIYLGSKVTGVELYAPCVNIASGANGSSAIASTTTPPTPFQYPLVYATGATNITPPTGNGQGSKTGSANPAVFIGDSNKGQGITLTGAVYAPGSCSTSASWNPNQTCSGTINGGTVEFSGNNDLTSFVEAENIWVDKNNFSSIIGNGPTNPFGSAALTN